ncbi:hypothetical protein TEQG_02539 [Trichophyton equinum CBS 127.97]|uniref:Uncharacterized protein n=1 Tax=Trichophyton equinum (strain ATCC MYA-4606 / CBS 127.97) TaxID=559882 RepID=F2PNP1_TRIEC|nr:hypothetical protein TEQG_02539 [Trichophyton equinum CBS 127.97]
MAPLPGPNQVRLMGTRQPGQEERVRDAENPEPDRQTQTIRPVAKGVKAFRPLSAERGPKVFLRNYFMARCQVFIASETQARAELRKTPKGIRTNLNTNG